MCEKVRLAKNAKAPFWWTAYNNVKHSRTLDDPDTQEQYFHKANLETVCNAFAALYLLEKKYMKSFGKAEEYNRCKKSRLFECHGTRKVRKACPVEKEVNHADST